MSTGLIALLDDVAARQPLLAELRHEHGLNPALGLRAIRWSLAEPGMFRQQLRAILRASKHGKALILIPMLSSWNELNQSLAAVADLHGEQARQPVEVALAVVVPDPDAPAADQDHVERLVVVRAERLFECCERVLD